MAWACESHARALGHRTMSFYGGESASTEAAIAAAHHHEDRGRTRRDVVRGFLIVLSVGSRLGSSPSPTSSGSKPGQPAAMVRTLPARSRL